MHFGQQNCTVCTLGNHCPAEGLFVPISCPPGYSCNQEGIGFPETLCRVGHICPGGVATGLRKSERSCEVLEEVGLLYPCREGVIYRNMTDTLQPVEIPTMYLPSYFKNAFDEDDSWYNSVCCKSTSSTMGFSALICGLLFVHLVSDLLW